MNRHTFSKKEKLCSKIEIDALFKTGKSFKEYPIRVVYMPLSQDHGANKVLITVSKKRFRKAVSRNRVKRLIREAYRLQKPELFQQENVTVKYFALAFVYIGNEIPSYQQVDQSMKRIFEKLKLLSE